MNLSSSQRLRPALSLWNFDSLVCRLESGALRQGWPLRHWAPTMRLKSGRRKEIAAVAAGRIGGGRGPLPGPPQGFRVGSDPIPGLLTRPHLGSLFLFPCLHPHRKVEMTAPRGARERGRVIKSLGKPDK